MRPSPTTAVTITTIAAAVSISAVVSAYPPSLTTAWLLPFSVLLAVAVIGTALSVRITSAGSTSSINFLLDLGAIPLLGPTGAIGIAVLSMLVADTFIREKPLLKITFNASQTALAVAAAAFLYALLAPDPNLKSLDLGSSFLPFVAAGLLYFAVNSSLVSWIISTESNQPIVDVWNDVAGKTLLVDIILTPIALAVPLLYLNWGLLGLLLIIIPVIGLRYSYGLNIELRNLNRDLLRVLIKTLEAQDPYTSGHSVRVSENARAIAKQLGLRRKTIHNIETAALLHDIGKIGQDYSEILRQEGGLTEDQTRLIKEHPDRGADIVRPVRSLDPMVIEAIRHHHERYDGDGYPDGLAAEDIPIAARIIMVADTIDAMATDRPYRESLSNNEIREELRKYAGEQFDPQVVEAAFDAGILQREPYISTGAVA